MAPTLQGSLSGYYPYQSYSIQVVFSIEKLTPELFPTGFFVVGWTPYPIQYTLATGLMNFVSSGLAHPYNFADGAKIKLVPLSGWRYSSRNLKVSPLSPESNPCLF
jgi:hypothetical protein